MTLEFAFLASIAQVVWGHPFVKMVLGLLAANVVAGVAVSLYTRQFRLGAVADWLMTRALPYLLGGAVMQLVLLTVPPAYSGLSEGAAGAVWLFVIGALLAKILDTLREIGLPVPEALGSTPKRQRAHAGLRQ